MKKLLLILLCLPMIGFGQSKKEMKASISNQKQIILKQQEKLSEDSLKLIELNKKINLVENELEILKRTADYYYKDAISLFQKQKFYEAEILFNKIIFEFPKASLISECEKKILELINISNQNYNKIIAEKDYVKINSEYNSQVMKGVFFVEKDKKRINKKLAEINAIYEQEKNIQVNDDPMQECKFYETKRSVKQAHSGSTFKFCPYIVQKYNGKKYLRISTSYSSESWMFYDRIYVLSENGYKFDFETDYPEKQSDSGGYGVSEWSDNFVNKENEYKLIKMSESDKITIRFDGQYRYDIILNDEQLKAFKEIINKFKSL